MAREEAWVVPSRVVELLPLNLLHRSFKMSANASLLMLTDFR